MENWILLGALVLILIAAAGTVYQRSKKKTGCCGSGGDYAVKRKKLKTVIGTKTFRVEGMHCEKCANRVMEVVNDLPGAAGTVDLKQGLLTVSYDREVPDDLILTRLARAGYPGEPVK